MNRKVSKVLTSGLPVGMTNNMAIELISWLMKMVMMDCHQLSPMPTIVAPNVQLPKLSPQ